MRLECDCASKLQSVIESVTTLSNIVQRKSSTTVNPMRPFKLIVSCVNHYRNRQHRPPPRVTSPLACPWPLAPALPKRCPKREILSHFLSPDTMRVRELKFPLSGNTAWLAAARGSPSRVILLCHGSALPWFCSAMVLLLPLPLPLLLPLLLLLPPRRDANR